MLSYLVYYASVTKQKLVPAVTINTVSDIDQRQLLLKFLFPILLWLYILFYN